MQPLRVFSVIIAVLIIIATTSSNISFKPGNDVNNGINTKAPLIESIFLSIEDKLTFSSLLQRISAEEQVQQEVDQEENGKDSDPIMERKEEQDRGQSERGSSIGQEQEQQDIEEEQKQDEIKEDCGPMEHFDSEVDSCIPEQEKVCDDDIDNDNDGKVDSEDSDCLTDKNDQQQQDSKQEEEKQKDKEKLLPGEETSLDKKEDNDGGKSPFPIEEQNNSTSSDNHDTVNKTQKSSQNLTNIHSTEATSKNNASIDELHHYPNDFAVEDNFTITCHPKGAVMVPGTEDSITCTIENKTSKPIEMVLECSGLDGTGIECYINEEYPIGTTLIKEMSYTNISVLLVSRSSPPAPVGSYPFTISAEECINSDLC